MTRYPGAIWRPVTRYQSGSLRVPITPRRIVLHTAVSTAASMHGYFQGVGRATPHFYVNAAGEGEQYIDTDHRATACLDGNGDCIAVESWDNGCPGGQVPDWTPEQDEWLAQLIAWCTKVHGIPAVRLSSSRPGTTGVGWHRQGIDGNYPEPAGQLLGGRVSGGERWSSSGGKICPGDRKIRGIVDRILPRAIELLEGEDSMAAEDVSELKQLIRAEGDATRQALSEFRVNSRARHQQVMQAIDDLPDGQLTRADVRAAVKAALPDDEGA